MASSVQWFSLKPYCFLSIRLRLLLSRVFATYRTYYIHVWSNENTTALQLLHQVHRITQHCLETKFDQTPAVKPQILALTSTF